MSTPATRFSEIPIQSRCCDRSEAPGPGNSRMPNGSRSGFFRTAAATSSLVSQSTAAASFTSCLMHLMRRRIGEIRLVCKDFSGERADIEDTVGRDPQSARDLTDLAAPTKRAVREAECAQVLLLATDNDS